MDDNPAISLFQAGNIQLKNDLQNMEEAEDIEDQKRLQGEMQNLLSNALDDFNFEDQSTCNSSTNVSIEESLASDLAFKYKNVDLDDRLKVLYEARVREVKSLHEQMEKQQKEQAIKLDVVTKKYYLAEANKEKAEINYLQSREILTDKTIKLKDMSLELEELKEAFDNLQIKQVELLEENNVLKNINQDILEQKDMIQKGFSKSSVSERMLEEKYSQEIKQLRNNLESLHSRLQKKENEHEELSQKYKKLDREKNELMIEKSSHINSLSEHLQAAQEQCRDLIQVMEQLSAENERLKKNPSNISETVRLMGLKDQSDMINALHKELDKTKESQRKQLSQYEQLQKQNSEKVKECNNLKGEILKQHNELDALKKSDKSKIDSKFIEESIYQEHVKILQDENNMLNDKIETLKKEILGLKKIEKINLELKDKVNLLETVIKSLESTSTNNSIIKNENYAELEKVKNHIGQNFEIAKSTIQNLEEKILEYENQLETYELKIKLQSEREVLIKNLQEKATQFENYLKQQKELEKEMRSVGINTEFENVIIKEPDNEEIIKEKYEADMITKEINLRQELQKEFTEKLEKYAQELTSKAKSISPNNSFESCRKCERKDEKLSDMETALTTSIQQIKKITQERTDDREAISKLLNNWRENFEDLEKQKIIMTNKVVASDDRIQELQNLLQIRENGDAELLEKLKNEVESAIKKYNKKVLTDVSNMAENQLRQVTDVHRKMDEITISTEKQICEIEKKFMANIKSYGIKHKLIKKKSAK